MICAKCGIEAPAFLCRRCFDEEVKKIPGVTEDYRLEEQPDGSFKAIAIWRGIRLKSSEFVHKSEENENI